MAKRITKKHVKLIISVLATLFLFISGYYNFYSPKDITKTLGTNAPGTYKVIQFEDGDTITIDLNGTKERVRFIGVDTPETQDPRKPVQCFGKAASNFTKQLIGDSYIRLESDPLSSNRDRYDRLLRYIYLPDNRLVQAEIIKQGYGFAYVSFPFTKSDEFRAYEKEARQASRGLWNGCQPTKNQYGGYTSNAEN